MKILVIPDDCPKEVIAHLKSIQPRLNVIDLDKFLSDMERTCTDSYPFIRGNANKEVVFHNINASQQRKGYKRAISYMRKTIK